MSTIRRGVMTLWTRGERRDGCDPLLWSLSALLARRWFPELALVTDDAGAEFLCERLALPFDAVSLSLNDFRAPFWAAGKMQAYAEQQQPFVHLDADAFLQKPLPARLLEARVCAETPEPVDGLGRVTHYAGALCSYPAGEFLAGCDWLPLAWPRALVGWPAAGARGYNAGILGGCDVAAINAYAREGLAIAERNPRLAATPAVAPSLSALLEQMGLWVNFGNEVETLFEKYPADAEAAEAGYTHLMASKYDPSWRARAWRRLGIEFPEQARRLGRLYGDPLLPPSALSPASR